MGDTTTNRTGQLLEINLNNGFYFKGKCLDETKEIIVIRDKKGERIEIKKSVIILCREIKNGN